MTSTGVEFLDEDREHALKCEIAAETLRSFGSLRLRVTGHSMLPAIWPGDTLVVEQRDFLEIVPRDIILYSRDNRLAVHRMLRAIDTPNPRFITQGDAMPNPDAPVFPAQLLGLVTEIVRKGQRVDQQAVRTFAIRCVGGVLRHSALLSRLLVHLHRKGRNSAKGDVLCPV